LPEAIALKKQKPLAGGITETNEGPPALSLRESCNTVVHSFDKG
jgi:hypothetical protein